MTVSVVQSECVLWTGTVWTGCYCHLATDPVLTAVCLTQSLTTSTALPPPHCQSPAAQNTATANGRIITYTNQTHISLPPPHGATAPSGPEPPHYRGFTVTLDTPQSVGLLCTRDRPFAEISAWQHTTITTDLYLTHNTKQSQQTCAWQHTTLTTDLYLTHNTQLTTNLYLTTHNT